jgi:hypothetical protein
LPTAGPPVPTGAGAPNVVCASRCSGAGSAPAAAVPPITRHTIIVKAAVTAGSL